MGRPASGLLLAGVALLAQAQAPTAPLRVITPDTLQYRSEPGAPGAEVAVVAGNPQQGPYTIRVRFAPGVRTPPHWHPDQRVVTVLQGQYAFALGTRFDADALTHYGPGTVLIVPAGQAHFSAALEAPVVLQESGTGPTALVPAPAP